MTFTHTHFPHRIILSLILCTAHISLGFSQSANDYVLVTHTADLHHGDTIVIVSTSCTHALGVEQNTNNRSAVAITLTDGRLSPNNDVQLIVLESYDRFWLLRVGTGKYLHAAGNGTNNWLRTTTAPEAYHSGAATIDITNGDAIIEFQCTEKSEFTKFLSFNPGSSFNAPLFSCYDGENSVYLFRKSRYTSTGIDAVHNEATQQKRMYDLQGRVIGDRRAMTRGVYIENGRLKIVR